MKLNETYITAKIEYISLGKVRGHFEAYLNDCDLEHFKTLSKEDQIEYLEEEGELIIDDYSVNDRGELYNIEVHE